MLLKFFSTIGIELKIVMKNLRLFYLVILVFGSHQIIASDFSMFFSKADIFYNENIKDGRVDYESIKKNPETLDEFIGMAEDLEHRQVSRRIRSLLDQLL